MGQSYKLARTHTELGRVYEEKGDRTKAEETFKSAVGDDAEYAPAVFFLGKLYVTDRKTYLAGKTALQKYLQMDPRGQYAEEAHRLAP